MKTKKKQPKFIQLNWDFIRCKNTTLQEKIILVEIFNLSKTKPCNASNKHFSDRLDIKKSSVSRSLSNLESKSYILTNIIPNTRNTQRIISINNGLTRVNNGLIPLNNLLTTPLTMGYESKENIENKNIEVNIKESKPKSIYPDNLNLKAWELWKQHKKEKKQTYKPTGEKQAIKKLISLPFDLQLKCIEDSVSKNYSGFFTENFTGQTNLKPKINQQQPFSQNEYKTTNTKDLSWMQLKT